MMSDLPQNRRAPVRIDAEDGPWSVSVAESPHDTRSYSLYIKTPTHNLTLTRTAMEIVDLDAKLRDNHPNVKVPDLPLDANAIINMPPKRKSNFLNTLSRLASPHANKTRRSNGSISTAPSAFTSPIASPSKEQGDPFQSFTPSAITATLPAAVNSTALASYLTTISNTPALRQARVWKRFVRVRTDDLESVRVERAIKRVRSDLAAHIGQPLSGKEKHREESVRGASIDDLGQQESPTAEKELSQDAQPTQDVQEQKDVGKSVEFEPSVNQAQQPVAEEPPLPADEESPKTPVTEAPSNRLHRSRSADPDTSARLSRAFTSSSLTQDGASSQTDRETGDESSASGVPKPKKKRSMSVDPKKKSRKVVIDDFEMMRVLGKGCAGKVLLVRHKSSSDLYALKAITKRHVLAHQELQHTLTEQAVLKRMAAESKDPFVVKLWWSFHDKENLFLVMDFHPGGDLATQLARWGRLGRDRARFYAAEIVEGVEGLHAAGVIYRDLKPENILIGQDGHIVLTDFGLSKEFPRRVSVATAPPTPSGRSPDTPSTPLSPPWMKVDKGGELAAGWPGAPVGHNDTTATFCGTAEYLAPEVIQGLSYSYEVDWWSFGTMLFEMLTGITPFYASNHSDMYVRVLQDELVFPDDRALDQDTKSLIRGLLQRNPSLRMCEPRIKRHPYFSMIDWSHVYYKRYIPPYIPPTKNASDTQNFDDTFLDMEPVLDEFDGNDQTDTDQDNEHTDTDRTDGDETNTTPSQSRSSSVVPNSRSRMVEEGSVDVFDGYSFKGRHSVLLDDDDEDESSEEETDEDEEEALALKGLGLQPGAPEPVDDSLESADAELGEPKTPEARPTTLPPDDVLPPLPDSPSSPTLPELSPAPVEKPTKTVTIAPPESKPRKTVEIDEQARRPATTNGNGKPVVNKALNRLSRPRREKSGVHALDQYLSDGGDDGAITEHDEEDDDWDFVEAGDGEDRNGNNKGTSLFARGVVDRYRLAVFRKASTPTHRSVSGASEHALVEQGDSPSPTQRRGRNQGLTFRKPRQFLKPKTPPSSYSSKTSSVTARSVSSRSSLGVMTPSPSLSGTLPASSPSLKSKESATSMSDQSDTVNVPSALELARNGDTTMEYGGEKKSKKLKKYKENAEKVFSLFSATPRP